MEKDISDAKLTSGADGTDRSLQVVLGAGQPDYKR